MSPRLLLAAIASLVSTACRGAPSEEPPIVPIRNMFDQPRYDPQQASPFFRDGRAMRPLVPGTVAREMEPDLVVATGWSDAEDSWALRVPPAVLGAMGGPERLLARGRERYDIYCAPCHGLGGAGDGPVARRAGGAITPPTLHSAAMRHAPDGQIFATISNGVRNMPSYRHSIPTNDRWAIVAYVRALQLHAVEGGGG
ncbi:MAG: cytochrome c [Myxococcales bacterium]|nr:cytochrome c [Myxococcales bacterium]